MATRYEKGSKIDPELRGTVDFDFFESEEYENGQHSDSGGGDKRVQKKKSSNAEDEYYYEDDCSFESDNDSSSDHQVSAPATKQETERPAPPPRKEKIKFSDAPIVENLSDKRPLSGPTTKQETKPKPAIKLEKRRERDSSDESSSSDSDITEVSPLASRDLSPHQTSRQKENVEKTQIESKSEATLGNKDRFNMEVLMNTIMKLEKERVGQQRKNVMFIPPQDNDERYTDKNYSFQKEKLEEIERENHRLLHRILNQHQRKKKSISSGAVSAQYAAPPCKRQFHSALNRQKEQRRIEQDNLKILMRLQTVKPTKDVSRHELLRETRKQAMYGIPIHTSKKGRRISDMSSNYSNVSNEDLFAEPELPQSQMSRLQELDVASRSSNTARKKATNRPTSAHRFKPEWNDRW